MKIDGKEVQYIIAYSTWSDRVDFITGEDIEVFMSMRCIIDDQEVLEAYTKYDEDTNGDGMVTFVKIGNEVVSLSGDRLDHVVMYVRSRLMGNPVKEQLSIATLNWCLDFV